MLTTSDSPLDLLDSLRWVSADRGEIWRSRPHQIWVASPKTAREVLANRSADFVETSDFFHTGKAVFGPRSAQIAIGRGARELLRQRLRKGRPDLRRLIDERLSGSSEWPDAGNLLFREYFRPVLLASGSPPDLLEMLDAVVTRAVLAGARSRHSRLSRRRFRREVRGTLAREIQRRRAVGSAEPADLLDVVLLAAEPSSAVSDLVEVYLSFVFATVGSLGFALGWSVYLAGSHPESLPAEPAWIVREALRLWPVAWLFGRTPRHRTRVGGLRAGRHDRVNVCSYLVHRNPRHWADPDAFRPQRWSQPAGEAFIPFGHGPHSCAGAGEAMTLLEEAVGLILRHRTLQVRRHGRAGPFISAALAPPPFTLTLGEPHRDLCRDV